MMLLVNRWSDIAALEDHLVEDTNQHQLGVALEDHIAKDTNQHQLGASQTAQRPRG